MRRNPNLVAAQARALIDQLLQEPLLSSPTADDLVDSVVESDSSYARSLFNELAADIIMELQPEDRAKVAAQMHRIADRAELAVARKLEARQQLKADAALMQAADAGDRAAEAEARAAEAERQLADTEISRRVAERLHELAAAASPPRRPRGMRPLPRLRSLSVGQKPRCLRPSSPPSWWTSSAGRTATPGRPWRRCGLPAACGPSWSATGPCPTTPERTLVGSATCCCACPPATARVAGSTRWTPSGRPTAARRSRERRFRG